MADYFKAFLTEIRENCTGLEGHPPTDFELTDQAIASLGSCAIGLGPDQAKDGPYIKRLRQRLRDRQSIP